MILLRSFPPRHEKCCSSANLILLDQDGNYFFESDLCSEPEFVPCLRRVAAASLNVRRAEELSIGDHMLSPI